MKTKIDKYLDDSRKYISKLRRHFKELLEIADILKHSEVIYICGNGGSAATASHMVNDFQKMCGLKAMCLNDNVPLLTAWTNDNSYDVAFMRQLENMANEDDVLIVLSGSGNSKNLFNAVAYANSIGMKTIALLGTDGGRLKKNIKTDVCLHIESDQLHAEDWHLMLDHLLCELIGGN